MRKLFVVAMLFFAIGAGVDRAKVNHDRRSAPHLHCANGFCLTHQHLAELLFVAGDLLPKEHVDFALEELKDNGKNVVWLEGR